MEENETPESLKNLVDKTAELNSIIDAFFRVDLETQDGQVDASLKWLNLGAYSLKGFEYFNL